MTRTTWSGTMRTGPSSMMRTTRHAQAMLATRLDGADLGTRYSGEQEQLAGRVVVPLPGLPGTCPPSLTTHSC
jgi:hypothetical protein